MAFSEIELKQLEKTLDAYLASNRPPEHLRDKVDLAYRIVRQSVELYEVRAYWRDPTVKIEEPFAKATFVGTRKQWKVFWMRSDRRGHGYEPMPLVSSLESFLALVKRDPHGCFNG